MVNKSLGICIGAATISFVKTQKTREGIEVISAECVNHSGNPKLAITEYFHKSDHSDSYVVTTGRKFRNLLKSFSVSEPEAVEEAFRFLNFTGKYDAIASLGSENFLVYYLNQKGEIINVITGNKCASGTGEFFLQQIGRMNLDIGEATSLAKEKNPYFVSGRCSVFCKSDCTHALNKGTPQGEVVAGLCKMIAQKITELLSKQKPRNLLAIGGVCQNDSVVRFLSEEYPNTFIPKEAIYFEALGASLIGQEKGARLSKKDIFKEKASHFSFLEPLADAESKVTFKSMGKDTAKGGDICVIGLDVGSTTTKAVVIRTNDNAVVASVYLRTNGAPVTASIECYKELKRQINADIRIIGLGVTGSGRHIAGLHALTNGIVNEIIAHATASAYFDKDVDTIFEIGGQDSKYTYLTNGVPSDYAMNEACSAGTGSFLEESAKETLNIDYREIGNIALKAKMPPNFNEQCAAFIQSDIKNALHEGISKEDIVGGLVYSICMNYVNKVKGNRPIGTKVFMQGGVCYNNAVPVAMSTIINKEIIVPPEPGLMGAFGIALEIKNRINLGLMKEQEFNLDDLINRNFKYGKGFVCAGGSEKCDRKCQIAVIEIDGDKYPFGGACSKYYNQRLNIKTDPQINDYVKIRQELVFKKYVSLPQGDGKTIGISKSFLTPILYPLYYNFFTKLGFRVILSDKIEKEGIDKLRSAFCFPAEIAHGFFQDLINKKPDYIFMPHVLELNNTDVQNYKKVCVFAQAENYYLKTTFQDDKLPVILNPVINFASDEKEIINVFVDVAKQLGRTRDEATAAYKFAAKQQEEMSREFKEWGKRALEELQKDRNKIAIVLFGRAYNAFVEEANMGIPHKFASKGITVIPHDFLPSEDMETYENMYWYAGQQIIRSARFIKTNNQLFGTFITNFSCGPDSFIIDYFRKIMGTKPSLTLELDSHTADVGIDTRIDAALDIIKNYIELNKMGQISPANFEVKPLKVVQENEKISVVDSAGRTFDLASKEVEVLVPSAGRYTTQGLAAAFRSVGIHAVALPIPTMKTLKFGRSYTNCKECLPFIILAGSMIEYEREHRDNNRKMLFFVPTGCGPCRLGQYTTKFNDIIETLKLKDVGVLTLSDEDVYLGLGRKFQKRTYVAFMIADLMHDIEHAIMALAVDKEGSLKILDAEWNKINAAIEKGPIRLVLDQLKRSAVPLSQIKIKEPIEHAKIVSLVGEIYVRREEFSRVDLISKLSERGFVVKCVPVCEYVHYCNYHIYKGLGGRKISFGNKISTLISNHWQVMFEKKIKKIMSKSGLIHSDLIDVKKTMDHAKHLISEDLLGEGILTVGSSLREIMDHSCGVISIGPFACMPSRIAESILSKEMSVTGKMKSEKDQKGKKYPEEVSSLPFLHIETDGNAFPQIMQSRLEVFMLQAERFHQIIDMLH